MKRDTREVLQDVNHQAQEIQRLVVLMLTNKRVGRDWLLKMQHTQERLEHLIGRISG